MKKTLCILFLLVVFVTLVSADGKFTYLVLPSVAFYELQATLERYGASGYHAVFISRSDSSSFLIVLEQSY